MADTVPLTPQFVGSQPRLARPATAPQSSCQKSVCRILLPLLAAVAGVTLVVVVIRLLRKKDDHSNSPSADANVAAAAPVQYAYPRNVPQYPPPQQQPRMAPYGSDVAVMMDRRYQQATAQPYNDNKVPAYQSYADAVNSQGKVQILNEESFNKRILQQKEPALVAFVMQGCGHCENMKPAFVQAAKHAKIALVMLERSQAGALPQKYSVRGFPTVILFRAGEAVRVYNGDRSAQSLAHFANQ